MYCMYSVGRAFCPPRGTHHRLTWPSPCSPFVQALSPWSLCSLSTKNPSSRETLKKIFGVRSTAHRASPARRAWQHWGFSYLQGRAYIQYQSVPGHSYRAALESGQPGLLSPLLHIATDRGWAYLCKYVAVAACIAGSGSLGQREPLDVSWTTAAAAAVFLRRACCWPRRHFYRGPTTRICEC